MRCSSSSPTSPLQGNAATAGVMGHPGCPQPRRGSSKLLEEALEVPPSVQEATQEPGKETKNSCLFHRNEDEAIGLCVAFTVRVRRIRSQPPAVASSGNGRLPLPGAEQTG